jgi:cobyric acid synthase
VIALIDYKAGNLTSVKKALAAIGADVFVPAAPADLAGAGGIIVPGVGHFGATRALDQTWVDAILARLGEGRPLFGICLGMQWLYEGSDEAPELAGLGLLSGRCYRLGTVRAEADTVENTVRLPAPRTTAGKPDTTYGKPRKSSPCAAPASSARGTISCFPVPSQSAAPCR